MRLCVCVYKQGSYCLYGKDQNPLFHWLRPVPPRGPIEHLPLCRLTRFHPGSERGCCRPAGLHKLIFRPENASFQPTLPPRTNYTHAETHTVPSPTQCSALIHFPHTHVHNALCTTALGLGSAQLFSENMVRLLHPPPPPSPLSNTHTNTHTRTHTLFLAPKSFHTRAYNTLAPQHWGWGLLSCSPTTRCGCCRTCAACWSRPTGSLTTRTPQRSSATCCLMVCLC